VIKFRRLHRHHTAHPVSPTVGLVDGVPQVRTLMRALLAADGRIAVAFESPHVADALARLADVPVGVVILHPQPDDDHDAAGAAKLVRTASPEARVVVWDGFDLMSRLPGQPWIDAFVNRRHPDRLLPTVQKLLHLPSGSTSTS
jgi:hypothetical protein